VDNGDGTAVLEGTPASAGVDTIVIAASNGTGTPVQQRFVLTVR